MGPTMLFHLGAGQHGLQGFCDHFAPTFNRWWDGLGQVHLDEAVIETLVQGVEDEAAGKTPEALSAERDRLIIAMQKSVRALRS